MDIRKYIDLNTIRYTIAAELGLLIADIQDQDFDWKPYAILVLTQAVRILNEFRKDTPDVAP